MEKQILKCDICGGELEMQGSGKAVCTSCGMKYSTESLREKFNGLKVSVTGSRDDVAQWKELVNRYVEKHDYVAAEGVVKRILEAAPTDEFAVSLYEQLQDWKYLEIVNGVLVRYHGYAKRIVLPEGICKIGKNAFGDESFDQGYRRGAEATEIQEIIIPESVIEIEGDAVDYAGAFKNCRQLEKVVLPSSIQRIGDYAFSGCNNLHGIVLSDNITSIGKNAFADCRSLRRIVLPKSICKVPTACFSHAGLESLELPGSIEEIEEGAFAGCNSLREILFPEGIIHIRENAFSACATLRRIVIPERATIDKWAFQNCPNLEIVEYKGRIEINDQSPFVETPFFKRISSEYNHALQVNRWKASNLCQYCGGEFKGLFTKACSKCGKTKDY